MLYESGELKLNEDSIDSAWVAHKEAKKYDMVGGLAEEIEMMEKILGGESANGARHLKS